MEDSDHDHDHSHDHSHDHDHEHTDRTYERHVAPGDCTQITEDMEVCLYFLFLVVKRGGDGRKRRKGGVEVAYPFFLFVFGSICM